MVAPKYPQRWVLFSFIPFVDAPIRVGSGHVLLLAMNAARQEEILKASDKLSCQVENVAALCPSQNRTRLWRYQTLNEGVRSVR